MAILLALLAFSPPTSAQLAEQTDQSAAASNEDVLRFGFSSKVFADVNEADGLAAVQIWTENFAEANDIALRVESKVFSEFDILKRALVERTIDMVNITTAEYRTLCPYLDTERIFLSVIGGDIWSEYLLLVKADHPAIGLADLEGASLLVLENLQTNIAPHWLESNLRGIGLPRAQKFFGHIDISSKTSRVILPVFFGKTDACLVSRRAYETATELNPQIGNTLRVLCRSPRLIPGAACFRASYPSALKNQIHDTTESLHITPRGEQVLLLFKTERLITASGSDLESTLRVIESGDIGIEP